MTRRLTLTMVAVVTGALLLATVATLVVTRMEARNQVRRDLGDQAQRLARRIETVQRVGLAAVQVALRLEDGSYYVGQTRKTAQQRFQEHCQGETAARICRERKPEALVYFTEARTRQIAVEAEEMLVALLRKLGIRVSKGEDPDL